MSSAIALTLLLMAKPSAPPKLLSINDQLRTAEVWDSSKSLKLKISFGERCAVDGIAVNGKAVPLSPRGIASGILVDKDWFTTATASEGAKVIKGSIVISDITFGGAGMQVKETWTFTPKRDSIDWRIDRTYLTKGTLEDIAAPSWNFADMSTWTGALLGTGGVAWCKLFDAQNATYGVHSSSATLWNTQSDQCLDISAKTRSQMALKFTRQPDNAFTIACQPSERHRGTRESQIRFRRDRQDIWSRLEVSAGDKLSVTYTLKAKRYSQAFDRGTLKGIDESSVGEIMNTIGRIGVVDEKIMGSNGWYSGYAVLHEPWIALMGYAVNDPNYTRNMAATLDYQRDKAIAADGMVKSRWSYTSGDSKPGTYDGAGFYECQWGRLMDTQPSFAINVAEQFDVTGDLAWVLKHKTKCEAALEYLLRRDTNGNGLVEMLADSRNEHEASDWLDVIWASHENAFVNAQMYRALVLWSEIEALLGNAAQAETYKKKAEKLKISFNKPTSQGGFWDETHRWYVYWRDKDGSIHGNNLTLPVNFMAIGYGLCDDPTRSGAILKHLEEQMVKQNLFSWPANIYSFTPDETSNQPFPTYENGDIFLAWVELGIRSYAAYDPKIAVKYVKSVLDRYSKDGLAFQRYLRANQAGAGDDILANNCSAVVGLYRNIYGIQPKHNRLYLNPHLTPELNGTVVTYRLRKRQLEVGLSVRKYSVQSEQWKVESGKPFGVAFALDRMDYFIADQATPWLTVTTKGAPITLNLPTTRRWTIRSSSNTTATLEIHGLRPGAEYRFKVDGSRRTMRATAAGSGIFKVDLVGGKPAQVDLA